MDEAAGRGDAGPSPAAGIDRMEALELQVRQLTSRLAGWVEAQLVQALDDRRSDMKALRAELQVVVNEQLAGMRAESSSVLSVATRRLEVAQEQLGERLDTMTDRAVDAAALHAEIQSLRAELAAGLAGAAAAPSAGEALEQRVRAAMSRLSDSIEVRLDELAQVRRAELDAVRATLETLGDERAAQAASATASAVANMHDRVGGMAATLGQRVDDVEARTAVTAENVAALRAEADAGPARVEAFEQRVKAAMGRLIDSVETRLSETAADRASGIEGLRADLLDRLSGVDREVVRLREDMAALQLSLRAGADRAEALHQQAKAAREADLDVARAASEAATVALTERIDGAVVRTTELADEMTGLRTAVDAASSRTDEVEQRVKAAVTRVAESFEARMVERTAALRAEIDGAATILRQRVDGVEQRQRDAEERTGAAVEAKLAEVVDRRRAELDALRTEIQDALAAQLREARGEIGTSVADAHRRFVVSVDDLHERLYLVADQSSAAHTATAGMEALQETVTSDGRRIEALEIHTRRTDARLGEVVDAKLSEHSGPRGAALEGMRAELRAALDAHLAATRAEVTATLSDGRMALSEAAARLVEREARLERETATAEARLDALAASVGAALREAEERLTGTVQAKLAAVDAVGAQVAESRADTRSTMAVLARKLSKLEVELRTKVAGVADQVDAMDRASANEVGALAPLRSDLRLLQAQVSELAGVVAELRPRRKVPATPPAKKAVAPAKKAAGPARRRAQ